MAALQKLGKVDWNIPGHKRMLDISQAKDVVEWAEHLGLIDVKKRNMWTSFGAVLSKIVEQNQRDAFLCRIELPNPLRLTLKQKVFFLYIILMKEGDFIIPFMRSLPGEKIFSASGVVKNFYDAWDELGKRLLSSKEYTYINKGKELSHLIGELKPASAYLRVISKLENLTDLGILNRADERKYRYIPDFKKLREFGRIPSDASLKTPESLENAWMSFFESDFFSFVARIFEIKGLSKSSLSPVTTQYVLNAYSKLVGGLGLCRIDEISLLAGIEAIANIQPMAIEQKHVRDAIYDLSKEYGKLVSLHVDMLGNISYVKIDKSLLSKIK